MADEHQLTAEAAALYDRQLRVWGVETQKKLTSSSILIVGCTGLSAEVAKNIVLAGIGSVTLVDDAPCASRSSTNFLIHTDAQPSQTAAEASVSVLQEMNPLVKVAALSGAVDDILTEAVVKKYTAVLVVGQPSHIIEKADTLCRAAGVPFYAAVCRGLFGWVFSNLHEHAYRVEKKQELPNGVVKKTVEDHVLNHPDWNTAMQATPVAKSAKRISPLFAILRVCLPLEMKQQRGVQPEDITVLEEYWKDICKEKGVSESLMDVEGLQSYLAEQEEMAAVNAVVGGVIANDLIKATSKNGEPLINNIFMFSLLDGSGWTEKCLDSYYDKSYQSAPVATIDKAKLRQGIHQGKITVTLGMQGPGQSSIARMPDNISCHDQRSKEFNSTSLSNTDPDLYNSSCSNAVIMGKVPVRLKEVVYTLSPFEQNIMGGLWKDLPHKASHYGNTLKDAVIYCFAPLAGVVYYAQDYKEKEKQHHRF